MILNGLKTPGTQIRIEGMDDNFKISLRGKNDIASIFSTGKLHISGNGVLNVNKQKRFHDSVSVIGENASFIVEKEAKLNVYGKNKTHRIMIERNFENRMTVTLKGKSNIKATDIKMAKAAIKKESGYYKVAFPEKNKVIRAKECTYDGDDNNYYFVENEGTVYVYRSADVGNKKYLYSVSEITSDYFRQNYKI